MKDLHPHQKVSGPKSYSFCSYFMPNIVTGHMSQKDGNDSNPRKIGVAQSSSKVVSRNSLHMSTSRSRSKFSSDPVEENLLPDLLFELFFRERKLNTDFFSQTFRAPPGYPCKIPGYPAKKIWFSWFRGTCRTFRPPPLRVKDPHPTPKISGPKSLGLGSFFLPDQF